MMPVYEVKKCRICGKVRGCSLDKWQSDDLGWLTDWVCVSCEKELLHKKIQIYPICDTVEA